MQPNDFLKAEETFNQLQRLKSTTQIASGMYLTTKPDGSTTLTASWLPNSVEILKDSTSNCYHIVADFLLPSQLQDARWTTKAQTVDKIKDHLSEASWKAWDTNMPAPAPIQRDKSTIASRPPSYEVVNDCLDKKSGIEWTEYYDRFGIRFVYSCDDWPEGTTVEARKGKQDHFFTATSNAFELSGQYVKATDIVEIITEQMRRKKLA
ncbi:hypothetical protein [Yoonia maritima]|uniref:hypothetical protein n=1 Tax=Yoonia maritima TaxID=1435347 RepID=UPI003736B2B1